MKIVHALLLTSCLLFCWNDFLFASNDTDKSRSRESNIEGQGNTLSAIYKQREEAEQEKWQMLLEQQKKEQEQREVKRQQKDLKQQQREQQWKLIERQQIEQQRIKLDWQQTEPR